MGRAMAIIRAQMNVGTGRAVFKANESDTTALPHSVSAFVGQYTPPSIEIPAPGGTRIIRRDLL